MSEKLTPQQKMAVENRGGKLLVSAAAGSGKTKVLVDRLMSYLTDPIDPANLDDFLIITYTKAAASELRSKISDKLTRYIADHPENRDEIVAFVKGNGGLEYAVAQLDKYVAEAVSALAVLPPCVERDMLEELAYFTAKRIM